MDEKNNEYMDQEIINIIKNHFGDEITIHNIDRRDHLGKRKLDTLTLLSLKGKRFAVGFSKLERNLIEKECEHFRKSNKEKSN